MDQKNIDQILTLNRDFYESVANDFDASRSSPWKGWHNLVEIITKYQQNELEILDVGCGNGRLYEYLKTQLPNHKIKYIGIDQSETLIKIAKQRYDTESNVNFKVHDVLNDNFLENKAFNIVSAFGIFHHLPTDYLRNNLIEKLSKFTKKHGFCFITLWVEKPRKSKIKSESKIKTSELNDFFITFNNSQIHAYAHIFNTDEIENIKNFAESVGLKTIKEYKADGASGNANHYLVFEKI